MTNESYGFGAHDRGDLNKPPRGDFKSVPSVLDDGYEASRVDDEIAGLSDAERNRILREHYRNRFEHGRADDRDDPNHSSRLRQQNWSKNLLILFTFFFLLSFLAIVVTIVYTSVHSGMMTETGILPAIVSFATEVIRILIGN